MHQRYSRPLPRLWLMTDERLAGQLISSIAALPKGSGIIFRHYATAQAERRILFAGVKRVARCRGHIVIVAGSDRQISGDGRHNPGARRVRGIKTASVHSVREGVAAQRGGADLLFVSPVFSTRSHPGAAALGQCQFGLITRRVKTPVIALGGMTRRRFTRLRQMGCYGWAAIDALRT